MRFTKRHLLLTLLILAGLVWTALQGQTAEIEKDPNIEGRMRHIRSKLVPYTLTSSTGETLERWQHRDPVSGMVNDIDPRTLIVEFYPDTLPTVRDQALLGYTRSMDSRYKLLEKYNIYIITVSDALTTADLIQAMDVLIKRKGVKSVSLNYIAKQALVPNDPMYSMQEHHPIISSPGAWDIQPGGTNVVLAVVDSGVDYNHEDLRDAIWINPGEIDGTGRDDDGNGFIDDIRGWDFYNNDNNPFPDLDPDYFGDGAHGTHVAGIAAAIANNGVGVAGTGYRLQIMAVKVFGAYGGAPFSVIMAGVAYAIDNGADVINLSLGGGYVPAFDALMRDANNRNIAVIAAAGNENLNTDIIPRSPVSNDGDGNWVLGVAATDFSDIKAFFSNYGSRFVDVSAPGVNIYATFPYVPEQGFASAYGRMSGTSMACPVVAGVMGLLKAYRPNMPVNRLYAAISEFADDIDAINPRFRGLLGGGRVNSQQSLLNVDRAGIVAEIEPNDTFDQATPLEPDVTVEQAAIDPAGDIDFFSFHLNEGDVIEVEIYASRIGSQLDPYLTLFAPNRTTVLFAGDSTPGLGKDIRFRIRVADVGIHFIRVEDARNHYGTGPVGGPDYFYQLRVNILDQHPLPSPNLISPLSPPTAVLGINLNHPSGQVYLEQLTVRIETDPFSSGRIEPSDFMAMTADEFSGVAIYRDGKGPTEGGFDFTGTHRDDLIVPTELPQLRRISETAFEVTFVFYNPSKTGLTPNPLTFVPSSNDHFFDFFVVLRTSGNASHDESFFVTIPPDGLRASRGVVEPRVTFTEQGFGSNSYPEVPQVIFVDSINYINFTDVYNTEEQGLDVMSGPVPVIGINAISPANDGLYLDRVTVTLVSVPPQMSFLNVPGDNVFEPRDLAALTGDKNSGVSLYRDNPAGVSGVFEEDVDIHIPLDASRLFFHVSPSVDGATTYTVDLIPREDVPLNILALPPNDTQPNNGSDFYVVIRTSDRIRNGDTLRVEIRNDPETGRGGIALKKGSDRLGSRREITDQTTPKVFNLTARPKPRFFLNDLTGTSLRLPKESKPTAVVGIDAIDYGSNQLNTDGNTFGWIFDNISVDFLDVNADGDFTVSDFRPIQSNVSRDRIYSEYRSGVAIYMDDSTPMEDGIDDDGDGLWDEELLNNIDDDGDGLVDEDVGDDDPAGINGIFDVLDDYIPFFIGSVNPLTGQPSSGSGHSYNLFGRTDEQHSVYPQPPEVTDLVGNSGFRVNFKMEMYRHREIHYCQGTYPGVRTGTVLGDPIGSNFARASEMPLPGFSGPQVPIAGYFESTPSQRLECYTTSGFNSVTHTYHTEGLGMFDTSVPRCCSQATAIALAMSYNYVIEIPDDNEGPNKGDDFFVVVRTSNTINDGDDFRVRMDSGSITYRNYKTVDVNPATQGANNISPGANSSSLLTGTVFADAPINLRFVDMTTFGQRVDPLVSPLEAPLAVLGLDLDVATQFPEFQQPGFSEERITSMVLEFVDETPPKKEVEPNNTREAANRIFLGDTAEGVIQQTGDVDFFVFSSVRSTTAQIQLIAAPSLASRLEIQDATGNSLLSAPVLDDRMVQFPVRQGEQYYVQISEQPGFTSGPADIYTLLTWEYRPETQFFERRGFLVSNDPNRSDLSPFRRDQTSGIALYIDDASEVGRFEPFADSLIPLSDINPSIQVLGRGTSTDPFVYRVPLILSQSLPIPYDNFGDTAGNDYYIVLRPSANITFGDAFRVRMRSTDVTATAPVRQSAGETNRLTANVATVINDLTTPGQQIVNGSLSPLTTPTAIFGLDINDGVGGNEKLVQLNLRFLPGTVGDFTINDIAPITGGRDSGVALYRNRGNRSVFNEDEDELVPFDGGFTGGAIATLNFTAGGGADVPDDNIGENEGDDYFIVIRTSKNITHETQGQWGDRFLVEIPIENGIRYNSGFVRKTARTSELTPVLNTGPTLELIRPAIRREPPISQQYTVTWLYSDPDDSTELVFFISPSPVANLELATVIPDATQTLPPSPGVTNLSLTFDSQQIQQLARTSFGDDVQEVFVAGRISDEVSPPVIAWSSGSWDVTGVTRSAPPVLALAVEQVDRPRQQITVNYSLSDPDSPATGALYIGPQNLFDPGSAVPNPFMEGRYLLLDELAVQSGQTVSRSGVFNYAELPQGVYRVILVGVDADNVVQLQSIQLIDIPDVRWPVLVRDPVKASPLVADVVGDASKEVIIVTSNAQLNIFNAIGARITRAIQLGQSGESGVPTVESSPVLVDLDPTDNRKHLLVAVSEFDAQDRPVGALYMIPIVNGPVIIPEDEIQRIQLFDPATGVGSINAVVSTPAVGDIDGDGYPELVIGTGQGDLVAFNLMPTLSEQWRIKGMNAIQSSPAIGNVDNDPGLEIVVYTDSGKLYVLKSPKDGEGAPVVGAPLLESTQPGIFAVAAFSPSLGDVDGDGRSEIVIGTPSASTVPGRLHIINGEDGSSAVETDAFGAAFTAPGQITTAPALADVDGDGRLDIILVSAKGRDRGEINAFTVDPVAGPDGKRKLIPIFKHELPAPPESSPVVGDYNPGGNIFFGLGGGRLGSVYYDREAGIVRQTQEVAAMDALGTSMPAPAVVADLDNDGYREVIYVSNLPNSARVHSLESTRQVLPDAPLEWPTFKRNNTRTADTASPIGFKALIDANGDGVIDYKDLFILSQRWVGHEPSEKAVDATAGARGEIPADATRMLQFMRYWHR